MPDANGQGTGCARWARGHRVRRHLRRACGRRGRGDERVSRRDRRSNIRRGRGRPAPLARQTSRLQQATVVVVAAGMRARCRLSWAGSSTCRAGGADQRWLWRLLPEASPPCWPCSTVARQGRRGQHRQRLRGRLSCHLILRAAQRASTPPRRGAVRAGTQRRIVNDHTFRALESILSARCSAYGPAQALAVSASAGFGRTQPGARCVSPGADHELALSWASSADSPTMTCPSSMRSCLRRAPMVRTSKPRVFWTWPRSSRSPATSRAPCRAWTAPSPGRPGRDRARSQRRARRHPSGDPTQRRGR